MSWMPTTVRQKSARRHPLQSAAVTSVNDYSGPADGDFVRYVEQLMAAAQQRQVLAQRAQTAASLTPSPAPVPSTASVRASAAAVPDAAWGRNAGTGHRVQPSSAPLSVPSSAPPRSAAYDPLHKAGRTKGGAPQPPMPGRAQQATHRATARAQAKDGKKTPGTTAWVAFFMLAAVLMFARPEALPVLILVWVAWQVLRQIRGR